MNWGASDPTTIAVNPAVPTVTITGPGSLAYGGTGTISVSVSVAAGAIRPAASGKAGPPIPSLGRSARPRGSSRRE